MKCLISSDVKVPVRLQTSRSSLAAGGHDGPEPESTVQSSYRSWTGSVEVDGAGDWRLQEEPTGPGQETQWVPTQTTSGEPTAIKRGDANQYYLWNAVSELNIVEQAQRLSGNLTSLLKSSSRTSLKLEAVHHQVLQQLEELYRTEVRIPRWFFLALKTKKNFKAAAWLLLRCLCYHWLQVDISMKLQACTGSCQSASPLTVNHGGFQDSKEVLDKVFTRRLTAKAPGQQVPRLKLSTAGFDLEPSAEYKTIPAVRRELLTQFEDVEQNQIILEDSEESDILGSE